MKINLKRTGGFGNIKVNLNVDTDKVVADVADRLSKLVPQLMAAKIVFNEVKPDMCSYEVEIDDNGNMSTLRVNDGNMTDDFADLVDMLMEQSK